MCLPLFLTRLPFFLIFFISIYKAPTYTYIVLFIYFSSLAQPASIPTETNDYICCSSYSSPISPVQSLYHLLYLYLQRETNSLLRVFSHVTIEPASCWWSDIAPGKAQDIVGSGFQSVSTITTATDDNFVAYGSGHYAIHRNLKTASLDPLAH